jgi:hypothetical protein
MKKKLRPVIDILLDLEDIIDELCLDHGLQKGDVLSNVNTHVDVHLPDFVEEYLDGSHPVFYYGPREGIYGKRKKS